MIKAIKNIRKDLAYMDLVLTRCANILDACVETFNTDTPSYLKEMAIANNVNKAANNIRAVVQIYLKGELIDE